MSLPFPLPTAIVIVFTIAAYLGMYDLLLRPQSCRVLTRDGRLCRYNAKGRLRACHLHAHKEVKRQELFHLIGIGRRGPRPAWGATETVASAHLRGQYKAGSWSLTDQDRLTLILTFISTVATVMQTVLAMVRNP